MNYSPSSSDVLNVTSWGKVILVDPAKFAEEMRAARLGKCIDDLVAIENRCPPNASGKHKPRRCVFDPRQFTTDARRNAVEFQDGGSGTRCCMCWELTYHQMKPIFTFRWPD